MTYNSNIQDHFKNTFKRDYNKHIKPWMVNWAYQDKLRNIKFSYGKGLPDNFYEYKGPGDLEEWLNWQTNTVKPDYFQDSQIRKLIEASKSYDLEVINKFDLDFDFEKYDNYIGRNNAQDYIFTHFYPSPGASQNKKVLDFGAGYGRQVNLWSQMEKGLTFVGMDAIPKSYCLQHLYYSISQQELNDYIIQPSNFKILEGTINHLPTWRFDLIPDNYFDQILCVQVLQELNSDLVKYILQQFQRILKPAASLYIRDHDQTWRPAHKINVNKLLQKLGFVLEFKPYVIDTKDIHGIPRIWRKVDQERKISTDINFRQRLKEWEFIFNSATKGRIKNLYRKYIKSIFKRNYSGSKDEH